MLKRFYSAFLLLVVAFGSLLPLGPFNQSVAENCISHSCCLGPFAGIPGVCGGNNYWRSYSQCTSIGHVCCGNSTITCGGCNNNPDDSLPDY